LSISTKETVIIPVAFLGLAGMARAMVATLTVAQKLPKVKICDLLLLQPLFCALYNH